MSTYTLVIFIISFGILAIPNFSEEKACYLAAGQILSKAQDKNAFDNSQVKFIHCQEVK